MVIEKPSLNFPSTCDKNVSAMTEEQVKRLYELQSLITHEPNANQCDRLVTELQELTEVQWNELRSRKTEERRDAALRKRPAAA